MSDTSKTPESGHGEEHSRRDFLYIATGAVAAVGAGFTAWPLIDQMNPAANVRALAQIEIDLAPIPEGQQVSYLWQGKPVFVRHRTAADIQRAVDEDWRDLKDPQPDSERHKPDKPQWLVMVGVCTHLGCVPIADQGDYDGWFCPCHGSHYDTSGRIRKGPAPENLLIPPYEFVSDTRIVVG